MNVCPRRRKPGRRREGWRRCPKVGRRAGGQDAVVGVRQRHRTDGCQTPKTASCSRRGRFSLRPHRLALATASRPSLGRFYIQPHGHTRLTTRPGSRSGFLSAPFDGFPVPGGDVLRVMAGVPGRVHGKHSQTESTFFLVISVNPFIFLPF